MSSTVKRNETYDFDRKFEAQVVTLSCSRPRFFGRVGGELDPELFKLETSKHAMRAAHAFNREVGHGPGSCTIVIQRLRALMNDGRITLESIGKVADLFDEAEDAGLLAEDDVIATLAPMLRERLRDEAVQVAIEAFSHKSDLSRVVALEEKAARIGEADTTAGTFLGAGSFAEVIALKDLERLPTGVPELDSALDGGLQNGGLGVVIADSGAGKSMFLGHAAAHAYALGYCVAYATLENPVPIVLARLKANLTGVPINNLLNGDIAKAQVRLAEFTKGTLLVQEFTPYTTTNADLEEWVDNCERVAKRKVDLLVIDYGDKVGVKQRKGDQTGEYTSGRVVFEGFRIFANNRKMVAWTASQSTRRAKGSKKKHLDLEDTADSMHKIRVADLVVTMNLEDPEIIGESQLLDIFVAKHRSGRSRFHVGPMPTDYEVGRVSAKIEDAP